MRKITCNLPDSLYAALEERMAADKETCDHLVANALAKSLGTSLHTLFQVSTWRPLSKGYIKERCGSHAYCNTEIFGSELLRIWTAK